MTDNARRLTEAAAARLATRLETGAALLRRYSRRVQGTGRTLVLGGVRSGKSRHAEQLMDRYPHVVYVAAGLPPSDDDPEWAARVAAHQARRPAHWRTIETADLTTTLREIHQPMLVDCLGTWVSRVLDEVGAWQQEDGWQERLDERLLAFVDAWRQTRVPVVAVSNETGSGVVPPTASGRIFRDVLGSLNTAVAAESDTVRLVVAGRILNLR